MGILLEAEGLSLLPSRRFSAGSWSCFPGMEQRLRAEPVGTGHSRRLLSLSLWFVRSQSHLLGAALGSHPLRGAVGRRGWTLCASLGSLAARGTVTLTHVQPP